MKSLLKIIRRYIGTAFFITFTILLLNIIVYAGLVVYYNGNQSGASRISEVAEELSKTKDGFSLSPAGQKMMEDYKWAFLLNDDGDVIWSMDTPEDFPDRYTVSEVASFTKWYFRDYPVTVWNHTNGLLVLGQEKNTIWKSELRMDYGLASNTITIVLCLLLANMILVLALCLLFGFKFYRSLKPVVAGIEGLAREEEILLPERGITAELAEKLNCTARRLKQQKQMIAERDTARTRWIAGVSHDIRTPLSMIVGYSEQLEQAQNLDDEQKKQVRIMKNQSIKIKTLIEDLNLTSKLQYQMQPLRKDIYQPAKQMRELVTSYYNNGLSDLFQIELVVAEEVEASVLMADTALLTRAYDNLIGNSIRHNEAGCRIKVDRKSVV